jgi:hypothetical protein
MKKKELFEKEKERIGKSRKRKRERGGRIRIRLDELIGEMISRGGHLFRREEKMSGKLVREEELKELKEMKEEKEKRVENSQGERQDMFLVFFCFFFSFLLFSSFLFSSLLFSSLLFSSLLFFFLFFFFLFSSLLAILRSLPSLLPSDCPLPPICPHLLFPSTLLILFLHFRRSRVQPSTYCVAEEVFFCFSIEGCF